MGRPIYGHVLDGYWQDIGNLDQYRQANFDALDEKVRLNIAGVRLRGNVWIGEGADIHDAEEIEGPAFIGNHCRIARDASVGPYTVLSNGVTLRERARTVRTVIDSSTHVGRSALIEGAIVGRSCDIRDHVRIQEGAAIGDEVTIGSESSIMPHVRIYPYKEVETGSQLYENLIWETRASSRLFGKDGVTGLVNVDLTPETAARLATALGTALKRGARVVASRDGAPGCRMIKRAMISGLNAAGLDVADLRVSPPAVSRHVLKTQGFAAAVHVGLCQFDPDAGSADGDREELHTPGVAPRRRGCSRLGVVPGEGAGELRPGPARLDRRGHGPRAPLPDRRRLRLLRLLVRTAARRRPDGGRGDLGARLLRRGNG
jgi:mannose-1-phosphate guanylyltransferase/phosphomannomutase